MTSGADGPDVTEGPEGAGRPGRAASAGPPVADPLKELAARMRAAERGGARPGAARASGAAPDALWLSDALWLADRMVDACRVPDGTEGTVGAEGMDGMDGMDGREGAEEAGEGEERVRADGARAAAGEGATAPVEGTPPGRPCPSRFPCPDPVFPVDDPPAALHPACPVCPVCQADPYGPHGPYDQPGDEAVVPLAPALPDPSAMARALRPLRAWRPAAGRPPSRPSPRAVLDEPATAHTAAATGCVLPVFRPGRTRRARMRLLFDDSPSMVVWQGALEELRLACEQSGVFGAVTVHRLCLRPDGGVGVRYGNGGGTWVGPLEGLPEDGGRPTLTLLLSDCSGALWRRGAAWPLLGAARSGRAAVVQPLPPRLWPRTLVRPEPGVLRRSAGDDGALAFQPLRAPSPPPDGPPLPVLPLRPDAVEGWARLLSGRAGTGWHGWAARPGEGRPRGPGDGEGRSPRAPDDLVEDFRRVASPAARRLAVCLSAAPTAYPVMRLVQRALLPESGPAEMAEVLLSGLLVPAEDSEPAAPSAPATPAGATALPGTGTPSDLPDPSAPADPADPARSSGRSAPPGPSAPAGVTAPSGTGTPSDPATPAETTALSGPSAPGPDAPGGPWYAFVPGVRELLQRRLGRDEARSVLEECSRYVERTFGRRAQNFPALVAAQLSAAAPAPGPPRVRDTEGRPVPRPFAEVSRSVLRRFRPQEAGGTRAGAEEAGAADGHAGAPVPDARAGARAGGERAVASARRLLRRYEQRGAVRDLWETVRLLRGTGPTAESATLLAEGLLALWDIQRDREDLREAERVARTAAALAAHPPPGTPDSPEAGEDTPDAAFARERAGAHLVLGRVLYAGARATADEGTRAGVLAEAAESLERAYALLRSEPRPVLDVLLAVVEVVQERYRLSGDRRLLYGAQVRLDALLEGWPASRPLPGSALLARGGLLRELGVNARRRDSVDEARALAVQAAADFASAASLAEGAGEPLSVVCRARLELAGARAAVTGDPGDPAAVAALEGALETAGPAGELRLRALWRLAEAHTARWTSTAEGAELDTADGYFAAAQAELPVDDPRRPDLLTARGAALLHRAEALTDSPLPEPSPSPTARTAGRAAAPTTAFTTATAATATDAVRVLRAALAQTPESDPRLPGRRLLFGRALRRHHETGGTLTDLHEAEWILARAAKGAREGGDTRTEASAWLERGDVLLALARPRTATTEYEARAAEAYRRASAAAESAGAPMLAALALHRRATVLERTAGPAPALAAYRAAWTHWQRAGTTEDPRARETLTRMRGASE